MNDQLAQHKSFLVTSTRLILVRCEGQGLTGVVSREREQQKKWEYGHPVKGAACEVAREMGVSLIGCREIVSMAETVNRFSAEGRDVVGRDRLMTQETIQACVEKGLMGCTCHWRCQSRPQRGEEDTASSEAGRSNFLLTPVPPPSLLTHHQGKRKNELWRRVKTGRIQQQGYLGCESSQFSYLEQISKKKLSQCHTKKLKSLLQTSSVKCFLNSETVLKNQELTGFEHLSQKHKMHLNHNRKMFPLG